MYPCKKYLVFFAMICKTCTSGMFEDHWVTAPISLAKGFVCPDFRPIQNRSSFSPPWYFFHWDNTNPSGISPNYLLQFLIGKLTTPRELTLVQPNLEPFQLSRAGRKFGGFWGDRHGLQSAQPIWNSQGHHTFVNPGQCQWSYPVDGFFVWKDAGGAERSKDLRTTMSQRIQSCV